MSSRSSTEPMEKQLSACVAAWFREFATEILREAGANPLSPKEVKLAMLEHYEEIFPRFAEQMPPRLTAITYPQKGQGARGGEQEDPMASLRLACRTEQTFQQMVNEYKRCFTLLLEGTVPNGE